MDTDVYAIPCLLVIGWRGEPGVKDEPQHMKQGKITLGQLDLMDIPYRVLSSDTTEADFLSYFDELASLMDSGKTVAFVGQSGVGKSSLLNYFCGNSLQRVGDVSEKKFRGTHTTTCGKLFHWAEGNLIDTPGVRSFLLWGIEAADLPYYYNEIGEKAQNCLFGHSCTHVSEKGCSVLAALEKGEITQERYESFLRIREELITGRITE
jgi:ribosome small subunit-dependent GTPase A